MSTDGRIPLEAVESSNLSAYGYDAGTRTLAVQFHSGRIFHYADCSLTTAMEFGAAESKGKFYATNIRGKLSGAPVTGKCPKCGDEGYLNTVCEDCGCADYLPVERRYEHATAQQSL